ncbi:GIY-YIG nuclease family protein [Winogradskyella schleiferi]|uniref:GIY-YIG nuclease family protein n=1 Tax=Winogradskyella schleiferi TaxID=2686078 RepID=UPI0015C0574F|nr:GIY-YIG nuclease family protein [Winogradskyella schleiferi]
MTLKSYYCYILTNKNRTVLYTGYTEDLNIRLKQHKAGKGALFTKKYNISYLVYFEKYEDIQVAKKRERQLKNWHKEWKWNLIKATNPSLKTTDIN